MSSSKKQSSKKKGGDKAELNLEEISNLRVQQELSLRGLVLDGDDDERRARLREAIAEGIEPMPLGQKEVSKMNLELQNVKKVFTRMFGTSAEIKKWGAGKRQVVEGGKPPANSEYEMVEVCDGFHPPKTVTEFSLKDDSRFNELPEDQQPIINVPGLSYKVRGAIGDDEESAEVKKYDTDRKHAAFKPLAEDEDPRYTGPLTGAKGKAKDLGLKSVKYYINSHMSPAEIKGFHYLTLVEQVKLLTEWAKDVAQPIMVEHTNDRATILRLEAIVQQLVIAINETTNGEFNESLAGLAIPGIEVVRSRIVPEVPVARVPEIQGTVDDYNDLDEFDMEEGGRNRYHLLGPQSSATSFTQIPRSEAEELDAPQLVQRVVPGKSPVGYVASQIVRGANAAGTAAAPMASSPAASPGLGVSSPSRKRTGGKAPRKTVGGKAPRKSEAYAHKMAASPEEEEDEEEESSSSDEDEEEEEEEESSSVSGTPVQPSPKRMKATDGAIQTEFGTNPQGNAFTQEFSFGPKSASSFSALEGGDLLETLFDGQLAGHGEYVAKGEMLPSVISPGGN